MVAIRKIKIGIVGAGLMGRWHANAAVRANAGITGIVDSNFETATRLARKCRGTDVYSSIEDMFDKTRIDVLHICTPAETHTQIAEKAINHGVNVIIEKPITPSAIETEKLLKTALVKGVRVCAVHQFVFQDGVQKAKIELDKIGKLIHIENIICSAGGIGMSGQQCNTIVADILPHPLSLMQFLLPDGIDCCNWKTDCPGFGEFRAYCETKKTTLSVFISMNARPTVCTLKIAGTNGTIYLDMFHGFAIMESGKVSRTNKILLPFSMSVRQLLIASMNLSRRIVRREFAYPGLNNMVSSFYDSVLNRSDYQVSDRETIIISRVRDTLIKNADLYRG